MQDLISRFTSLPSYGIGALILIVLYAAQAEIRFGARARATRGGASDRHSTFVLTLAAQLPVLAFVLAIKGIFHIGALPGLPASAWLGVFLGVCGLALRLWAVLTLRERYTRTLLIQDSHTIESRGPYRWVRHPGYLGSLLCLNGVALASGNGIVLLVSLAATYAAYRYRIRVEDGMLIARFGAAYVEYRNQVGALFPKLRM